MRIRRSAVGVVLAAGAVLGTATPTMANAPGGSFAEVVGVVQLASSTTAVVQARYRCTGDPDQLGLWVSVKQSENGTAAPDLAEEGTGYGAKAAAWSQGHGAVVKLRCDGSTRVGRFTVDRSEFGYGDLQRGDAYVQFCLFDATTGTGEDAVPVSSMKFLDVFKPSKVRR